MLVPGMPCVQVSTLFHSPSASDNHKKRCHRLGWLRGARLLPATAVLLAAQHGLWAQSVQPRPDIRKLSTVGVPLRFESNAGQLGGAPATEFPYVGVGLGYTVRLAPGRAAIDLAGTKGSTENADNAHGGLQLKL